MPSKKTTPPEQPALDVPVCRRLWTAKETGEFLGVPVNTLHSWRYLGNGPAAYRVGRALRYDPDTVRRWLAETCATTQSGPRAPYRPTRPRPAA